MKLSSSVLNTLGVLSISMPLTIARPPRAVIEPRGMLSPADDPPGGHGGHMGGHGDGDKGSAMGAMNSMDLSNPWVASFIYQAIHWGNGFLSSMKVNKIEEIPPELKMAGVKRVHIRIGPFPLETSEYRKAHPSKNLFQLDSLSNPFLLRLTGLPTGISILRANASFIDPSGAPISPASGIYNHHVAFINADKPPVKLLSCGNKGASSNLPFSVIFGAGEEAGDGIFHPVDNSTSIDSGYWLAPKSNVVLNLEVTNYSKEKKEIYQLIDMHYAERRPEYDAGIETINVLRCDSGGLGVKPDMAKKKFAVDSKELTFQDDGYIVRMQGHLHDGGESLSFYVNGKEICMSEARYGEGGSLAGKEMLSSMSNCERSVKVNKGDKAKISARYDFEKHPQRPSEADIVGLAGTIWARKLPTV